MDVEMDVDMDNVARREPNPPLFAAQQRRPQHFGNTPHSTTSQRSAASTSSFPTPSNNPASNGMQPSHQYRQQMTAPLPSPSAAEQDGGNHRSQSFFPNSPSTTHSYFHPQQSHTVQSHFTSQQSSAFGHLPQQGVPQNNPAATSAFLKDFNLVAEAAKRAQMAVVMRDLEAVSL